jgi:hypothetical protein
MPSPSHDLWLIYCPRNVETTMPSYTLFWSAQLAVKCKPTTRCSPHDSAVPIWLPKCVPTMLSSLHATEVSSWLPSVCPQCRLLHMPLGYRAGFQVCAHNPFPSPHDSAVSCWLPSVSPEWHDTGCPAGRSPRQTAHWCTEQARSEVE